MVKIAFDVPIDMAKLAQSNEVKDRPYDLCLKCPFMKDTCDGPNVLAMEYLRWVEWANSRAKQMDLTRSEIAELSCIPKGTLNSVLAGRTQDIRLSTMRAITKVLIGGCWGQYPCHFAALLINGMLQEDNGTSETEALRRRVKELEGEIEALKASPDREIHFLYEQIERKDARIRELSDSVRRKEQMIVSLWDKLDRAGGTDGKEAGNDP